MYYKTVFYEYSEGRLSLSFGLWLFIFVFFTGFWAWTSYITMRQMKAWQLYAKKRKLRYHSNGVLDTPSVTGSVDGYKISIFASEHSELDARSQRRLTAIEVSMHTGLPVPTAIASGGMVPVMEPLDLNQELKPQHPKWDDSFIARTRDNKVLEYYLEAERLDKLVDLMGKDKVWVVLLFLAETGLLRMDTPLPLDDPRELDKAVKTLIDLAKALELRKGEAGTLMRKSNDAIGSNKIESVDEGLLVDNVGFELEED